MPTLAQARTAPRGQTRVLDEARSFAADHDMDIDEAMALIKTYGTDRETLDEVVEQMYR
ncbi:hypothetical protein [Phenylobacterium immobile]|uniref:hypothetical protein n=1 Tax=Phenylobacterium immobile TaxID=21 RepID=UPI000A58909C|nr:hypothetical protein [Phenylobacterium immobile]